ncbi:MAG: TIGR00725 family protein [Desulfobacteraceae bacterium]|nr:TIGR00725 family protein [Desulfobacteraceae bacterium]
MPTIELHENPRQIGVFGSGTVNDQCYKLAYEVGAAIARLGHIVINGGLGGVMEASARGAADAKGLVIGVLPGDQFDEGNQYSTVKILTGMQYARNYINGLSCHGAIVVSGSSGAYEEARRVWEGRGPVVVLAGSGSPTGAAATMMDRQVKFGLAFPEDKQKPYDIFTAHSPEESAALVINLIEKGYPHNESE